MGVLIGPPEAAIVRVATMASHPAQKQNQIEAEIQYQMTQAATGVAWEQMALI
ncbi:hypothetical protein QS468_28025 [Bacillus subtilis]|nr:hypothetical protein [Pseudomonas sp. A29(2023)]MDL5596597.1 hypothetical protein [Bacillus subtilis]